MKKLTLVFAMTFAGITALTAFGASAAHQSKVNRHCPAQQYILKCNHKVATHLKTKTIKTRNLGIVIKPGFSPQVEIRDLGFNTKPSNSVSVHTRNIGLSHLN